MLDLHPPIPVEREFLSSSSASETPRWHVLGLTQVIYPSPEPSGSQGDEDLSGLGLIFNSGAQK